MAPSSERNKTSASRSGTEVFLALGSNKGDSEAIFRTAMKELAANGFQMEKCSPLYQTEPVDCDEGVPPFINAVISGVWHDTPEALLDLCQSLERRAGRPEKHSSRQSRELDLDIILFGSQVIRTERLIVPHPRAFQRAFVLVPLNDIAPDAFFADGGKSAAELLKSLPDRSGIELFKPFLMEK